MRHQAPVLCHGNTRRTWPAGTLSPSFPHQSWLAHSISFNSRQNLWPLAVCLPLGIIWKDSKPGSPRCHFISGTKRPGSRDDDLHTFQKCLDAATTSSCLGLVVFAKLHLFPQFQSLKMLKIIKRHLQPDSYLGLSGFCTAEYFWLLQSEPTWLFLSAVRRCAAPTQEPSQRMSALMNNAGA